ncbi:MAG: class I SAM-dependent methyltransferase [Rhodospirillales bacterium]
MTGAVYRLLHGEERIFELDELLALDLQGWGSNHPVFERMIDQLKPRLIVEVGSWKGASAIHMAQLMKQKGLSGEIVCIDTFLGSPEHWTNPEFRPGLRLKHGQPRLYDQFISNIVHSGMQDIITPFAISSTAAAVVLARANVRPELIYIDASHEYEDVKRDLELYWQLLAPGGVMLGDDFLPMWYGVIRAASEFAKTYGLDLQISDEKWLVQKPA